jgi:hypothetical protein
MDHATLKGIVEISGCLLSVAAETPELFAVKEKKRGFVCPRCEAVDDVLQLPGDVRACLECATREVAKTAEHEGIFKRPRRLERKFNSLAIRVLLQELYHGVPMALYERERAKLTSEETAFVLLQEMRQTVQKQLGERPGNAFWLHMESLLSLLASS